MALSQLQCLDDHHVNPRTHASKPDFLYCEDQRLALEALLRDGRDAFLKCVEDRGLRGFLSDPELETLTGTVETYDPGADLFPEDAEEDEPPLSQHYWPDLSDTSIPQMDLGWPDCDAYRGVTRATIYSQPPVGEQAHIKEVVRKMIAQAQKVIAVVMDVFTDVDIFRDLLDAGFKRKVSVYILLELSAIPHFLAMCQRANMHAGHLKHLRVRCTGGREFYTRSSTKVRGRMGHRFMFVDGDKAFSGSYSFTWTSSRLDSNLITVVTGQAVDAFDKLFRILYMTSSSVNLRQVATEPEPEPEPLPQPVPVAPPSAAIARKLYNPKYALVLGNSSPVPSPTPSAGHNSPGKTSQENSGNPEAPDTTKRRRRRASKEAIQYGPPIHPGLTNLEKACLISYLPTWPEPDPPNDVIGFINVRDASKPIQVHLQRSEMFETSQAIRFSSPFSKPEKTLPEVAKPTPLKNEEMNIVQPAQVKSKTEESVLDRVQPTQLNAKPGHNKSKEETPKQNSPAFGSKCESDKLTAKTLSEDTPTNQNAGHNPAHPQSSSKASTPNTGRPSHTTQAVTTNTPESLSGPNTKQQDANLKIQRAVVNKTHTLESQTSNWCVPTETTKTASHKQADHMKPQISETTPNINTTDVSLSHSATSAAPQPVSRTSRSDNNVSITTHAPSSSLSPPPTSSSSTLSPTLTSTSTSLTSTPPIPKPRTMQLVIKDSVTDDGRNLQEVSVRRAETSSRPGVAHNEPAVATVVQKKSAEKSGSKTQKDAGKIGNIAEAPQQKQSSTSHETKNEEAVGLHDDRAGMQLVAGANIEAQSINVQKIIPRIEAKTLTLTDSKLTSHIDSVSSVKAENKTTEGDQTGCGVPNTIRKYVTQSKTHRADACEPQRTSHHVADIDVLERADSLKTSTHTPLSATHRSKDISGETTHTSAASHGVQRSPSFTAAHCPDSASNTGKHNTHSTFQELIPKAKNTPEKSLRGHLSDTHGPGLRSPTPERESWFLAALMRSPTPDGFPIPFPRTPTPDSRTHTPDPRPYTPDLRTPTSDVSDGYVSARTDSIPSTTSEEFYECSDSLSHEPVFERAFYRNHSATEDYVSFTHTNTPNATTFANYNTCPVTLDTLDRGACSSTTLSLSSVSSSSSLLDKVLEQEKLANEENAKVVGEKGRKVILAERKTEGDSKGTQRRGSQEGKNFKQGKDTDTDTAVKHKETRPQAPQRKRLPYQPGADRSVDVAVTPGELTSEGAQSKRTTIGDLKPKKVPSEGDRADKERAVDRAASGSSSVERRDKPQPSRETEGHKSLHTSPRLLQRQQKDHRVSSPSRPLRPMSGTRPTGSHQLTQTERRVLDSTSSSRKPLRPPAPVVAGAAWRKQAEISTSQQSGVKAGQSPNRHSYPKAQPSFLHTHSNLLPRFHSQPDNQTVPAEEVQGQEEEKTSFSVTFSKLYNLKGLKDKMSKVPTQSKRDSSSPAQGRKSMS